VYFVVNRLTAVEVAIGFFGVALLFISIVILGMEEDLSNKICYVLDQPLRPILMCIAALMIIVSIVLPSTETATKYLVNTMINPADYDGNIDQFNWDHEVLTKIINTNY
jgi:drug/metabolite transporter (DMT)-like permease